MVKSKTKFYAHAWRPLKGRQYKAILRIHYCGSREQALKDLTGRAPFTQRPTEDYDRVLQLRKDLRYLNLPSLDLFEVRLNKHHHDCVELWLREPHLGDDDLQRELVALEHDLEVCREGGYFSNKEISRILLFLVRPSFADLAPNWKPIWHINDANRSAIVQLPRMHESGSSTYTRSSSPSRLSDVSGDVQNPTLSRFSAPTTGSNSVRPRKRSVNLVPSAKWIESIKATDVVEQHPAPPSTNGDMAQPIEDTLPDNHPESWTSVRPRMEDALKPLFDEFPQARSPMTASPFSMCRAIKTALGFKAERPCLADNTQRLGSGSSASDTQVRELEAQLAAERSARFEAEALCKSAEADLDFLREAHAKVEEELADLRAECKAPVIVPALYQAFIGVHGIAREVDE